MTLTFTLYIGALQSLKKSRHPKQIWIELSRPTNPLSKPFLGGKPIFDTIFVDILVFQLSIPNGPGPTHPLPNVFLMFGFFLTLQYPLVHLIDNYISLYSPRGVEMAYK